MVMKLFWSPDSLSAGVLNLTEPNVKACHLWACMFLHEQLSPYYGDWLACEE
jgi:hypothetical protein